MHKTILIVDDLDINIKILNQILSREYNIIQANNGLSAIEILNEKYRDISAVLLDVEMPELNGYDTLARIRESDLYSQMPVIIVTATEDENSRKRFLAIGANDFLTKPYAPDLILHCIKNNLMLKEVSDTVLALQRDKLTGLLVRDAFFEKVQEMVSSQKAGYYIMACFDVEKFKVINDQYGTEKGDEVLKFIAITFKEGFNKNGGICCRINSDNFAVLYPTAFKDSKEIENLRLKASLIDGLASPVFFCIGRYLVDDLSVSPSAMYDRARIAADSVKGRFDVRIATFDKSMLDHLLFEQEMVSEMQGALEKRQFEVWYQPQFNHSTKAIIGSEALVRWRHPQKGLISPFFFIPVFERNGFIYQLDRFVWEEVCKNLRRWIDDGRKPLAVSVNISRYDLLNDDVVDDIFNLVQKYSLPVDLLRLEITESAFSQNSEKIIQQASKFIDLGFTLEIDDFGSGYSSLNSLKDVPAQIIKLDMKFMDKNNSQRGGNIVSSIVRMSKWLGMSVIAEGVETIEQADFLTSVGCSYIQGYLYAKPMGLQDYEDFCIAQSKEEHLMVLETVQNLDNNDFWDPNSMDTLIFNSYVGAACIIELYHGKIEMLRATEHFLDILSNKDLEIKDVLAIDWAGHMDERNTRLFTSAVAQSIASRESVIEEFEFHNLPKCSDSVILRSTLRVIATAGERILIYCLNENITSQREAAEQLRFLNDAAHDILAQPNSEKAIEDILKKLLDFFAGERAYIIELNDETQTSDNTYECCAPGITSEIDRLQGVPYSLQQYWFDLFIKDGYVTISDVSAMDEDKAAMRELLLVQNIRSLIEVPLWRNNKLIGYIGMDNPTKAVDQVGQLIALSDYFAVLLTRRDLMKSLEHGRQTVQQLVDDTPGGFLRLEILPDNTPVIVSINAGFCRILGMTYDEVMKEYGGNAHKCLVAEDVSTVKDIIATALAGDGSYTYRCRLKKKDGSILWVQVYGRYVKDENGKLFRNSYFADITEQRSKEQMQSDLLDNIPFGVAMYEFDGVHITVLHINSQYWKLVDRKPTDYKKTPVTDAIHPEDREVTVLELQAAIRQGRNAIVDIRVLNGKGGYSPFHVTASIILQDNGKYLLFVAYSPITNKKISMQEVLPKALSTMMAASDDISYIKGKDLHYITCSQALAEMTGFHSPRDLIGKSAYDLFDWTFAERFTEDDRKIIETGKPVVDIIEHIPTATGDISLARTSKYPIHDASGDVIGVYCISHDVTEQRRRDTQLDLLSRNIPGGLASFSVSKNGYKILYFNDGFFAFSGYTRDEYTAITEKDPLALMLEEDRGKLRAMLRTFATQRKDGMTGSCDYRCRTKDGQTRYMSLRAVLTQLDLDQYVINVVQFDVTNHVEAEQRIESLLDNLPFGAAMYEFDGEHLKTLHLNRQYQIIVARNRNSTNLENYSPTDFIYPDDRNIAIRAINDAITNHRDASCDIRILYRENEYRLFHIDARIKAQPDRKYLVYAAYTPISEAEDSQD